MTAEKRKKIEDLVIGTVSRLEMGTENTERYKIMFANMSDKEFEDWAGKFRKDNFDQCIQIFAEPFNEPTLEHIKNAAKFLGIELDEYIYYNDQYNADGTKAPPVRSKTKVPVGYVHIRRVQQLLSKKNHYATDIENRSLKGGDVTGHSKTASITDAEASALTAIGAKEILKEMMTFRSDSELSKAEAYMDIQKNGYISMKDLSAPDGRAFDTIGKYLLASGIHPSNMGSTLKIPYTIQQDLSNKH